MDQSIHQEKVLRFDNAYEALRGITQGFITGDLQAKRISGFKAWDYNYKILIENCFDHKINLSDFGYRKGRWTKFQGEYINQEALTGFLHQMAHGKKGQALQYLTPTKAVHSLGNCVVGLFGHVDPPEIIMISRTSKLLPVGALDLAFGSEIARISSELSQERWPKRNHLQPRLIWLLHQIQFHTFDCMPFVVASGLIEEVEAYKDVSPFASDVWKNYLSIKNHTYNTVYKSCRRYAERTLEIEEKKKEGSLPSFYPFITTPVEINNNLYYSAIRLKSEYQILRRDIHFVLRKYRSLILPYYQDLPILHNYDRLLRRGDPEFRLLLSYVENKKRLPFETIEDIIKLLGIPDIQTLVELQRAYLANSSVTIQRIEEAIDKGNQES